MLDGILNINKEKGYTSHDAVARLRGILKQKKIGHTGTLDPDATGVLPVCLGKATRLCDLLTDKEKAYRAVLLLGKVTDTQDVTGRTQEENPVSVSQEEVCACIQSFEGDSMQIPPMYSACRVQGKRLYELAREGVEVERRPRPIHIRRISIEAVSLPRITFEVTCGKGTYIRTLCHDIGQKLGCGGCMEALTRTRSGMFGIEQALTLAQVEKLRDEGRLGEYLVSIEQALGNYPRAICGEDEDRLLNNGNPLFLKDCGLDEEGWVRVCDSRGTFKGIYQKKPGVEKYFPVKMFL